MEIKALHPTKSDDIFEKALEHYRLIICLAFGVSSAAIQATEASRELSKLAEEINKRSLDSNPESEKVHDGKTSNTN